MTGLVVLDGNGVVGGGKVSDIFLSRACVRRLFFFSFFLALYDPCEVHAAVLCRFRFDPVRRGRGWRRKPKKKALMLE